MLSQLKLAFLCLLAVSSASSCQECSKAIDKAVSDVQTQVAQLLTATPGVPETGSSDPSLPVVALRYVASGDSVPAGADMPRAEPYGFFLFRDHLEPLFGANADWTNFSHSGDTTTEYLRSQMTPVVNAKPSLVTVTIGADDMLARIQDDFWEIARDPQCSLDEQLTRQNLNVILFNLAERTDAFLVVTNYYNPLGGTFGENIQGCIDVLNSFIAGAVASVQRSYPGRIVLVDISNLFLGHEWFPGGAATNSYIEDCREFICVHPNIEGQTAISEAIWKSTESRWPQQSR